MLYLDSLTATSFSNNEITLTWEWETTTDILSNYTLDILRAEGPVTESEYDLIGSGISSEDYSYTDTTISGYLLHKWRDIYYRLRIEDTTSTGSVYTLSDPVSLSVAPDVYAQEIIRDKNTGVNRYGRDLAILKRRTFGTRCTNCWDPTLGRRTIEDCLTCYDTGWIGGFFDPIVVKGVISPVTEESQITAFGQWQTGNSLLTMTNYPPLVTRDVIVDETNRRFRIEQVVPTEFKMALLAQRARISYIDKDDVVYRYPITEL